MYTKAHLHATLAYCTQGITPPQMTRLIIGVTTRGAFFRHQCTMFVITDEYKYAQARKTGARLGVQVAARSAVRTQVDSTPPYTRMWLSHAYANAYEHASTCSDTHCSPHVSASVDMRMSMHVFIRMFHIVGNCYANKTKPYYICCLTATPAPTKPAPNATKVCSGDASCNVCPACCKSYLKPAAVCAACVKQECPKVCSGDASCNVCPACCKSYLKPDAVCKACVKQECHNLAVYDLR